MSEAHGKKSIACQIEGRFEWPSWHLLTRQNNITVQPGHCSMTYDDAKRVYFVRIRSYMFLAANPSKEVFSSILGMSFSLISILFYGFLENLTLMQIKIPQLTEVFIILKLIFMKLIFFGKLLLFIFWDTIIFDTRGRRWNHRPQPNLKYILFLFYYNRCHTWAAVCPA